MKEKRIAEARVKSLADCFSWSNHVGQKLKQEVSV